MTRQVCFGPNYLHDSVFVTGTCTGWFFGALALQMRASANLAVRKNVTSQVTLIVSVCHHPVSCDTGHKIKKTIWQRRLGMSALRCSLRRQTAVDVRFTHTELKLLHLGKLSCLLLWCLHALMHHYGPDWNPEGQAAEMTWRVRPLSTCQRADRGNSVGPPGGLWGHRLCFSTCPCMRSQIYIAGFTVWIVLKRHIHKRVFCMFVSFLCHVPGV